MNSNNNLSTPNGVPDPNNENNWKAIIWRTVLGMQNHTGKLLLIPLVISSVVFVANIVLAISDDGVIDEQEFHSLLQGASSSQMVILALVMALLKIRKP